MSRPVLDIGFPDEMQARELIIEECQKLGSKQEFCRRTGISRRYFNLIMEWKRSASHDKVRAYFKWPAVYVCIEDIADAKERQAQGWQRASDFWRRKREEKLS